MAADGGGIGALLIRIGGDATELLETFSKASKGAKDFGSVVDTVKGALKALAAAAAPAAVIAWTKSMADAADQAGKMAQKVGMTTEALSELQYAAKLADVSTEQLQVGLVQLSKHMEEARSQFSDSADVFRAMGVTVTNGVNGPMRITQEVLFDLADKFARMEDGAGKTAIAVKLFGRSGAEMIPLLNQGAAGLRENAEEARKFGVVISTDSAKAAEEFNDNMRRLKAQSEGLARSIGGPLVTSLAAVTREMLKAKEEGASLFEVWGRGLSRFVGGSDLDQLNKKIFQTTEQLQNAQDSLNIATYNRKQSGGNPKDDPAIQYFQKQVNETFASLKALIELRKNFYNDEKKKDTEDKEPPPVIVDSKAAAAREQEVRDILHRVRVESDARDLAQIELTNRRRQELAEAQLQAQMTLAERMAERAANPLEDDESNRSRRPDLDQRQTNLLALRQSMKSAEQIENEAHEKRLLQLKSYSDQELEIAGGRQAVEQDLALQHQDRLMAIRRQGLGNLADFNKANWADQTKHVIGSLADMTASAAQHNRGMFEINKVASMATAIVKGWEAVQSSYAFGSSWGGPVAGAAMAALAATATAINVMAIKNASFGGGASPSVSTVAAPPVQVVNPQQNAPQGATTTVHLHGETQRTSVLMELNKELENGGKIVFVQEKQ